ncbi:pectinesterase inhibitor 12-like [Hordeum vulgare subsp. vulgare]|uniref:Pectinesterase inhibitor domain-containing protein n=1 Tax=Hordeum vulgare subsp. vulgare TaxID=112509 RepID=A0A8I7B847_HORVV|nr:pectinesterase inhibitor 12-like [Hordeum vulgare subsp. vulgare]
MRHSQALSCLLVILFLLVSSNASTLDDTCKSIGASKKDIGYDYCIKFFQANNESATADKRGLVVIGTKITRAEATNIRKRIDALKASVITDKKVSGRLSDCRVNYTAVQRWLEVAAKSIKSGNLQEVKTILTNVILGTDTCEEGFRELGVPSPLAAEDAEFSKDCSIALAITTML